MINIRPNYKHRRAETIMEMRKKGMSYNKISFALGGAITPQRVHQIVKHYESRIKPKIDSEIKEFLNDFDKNIDK
jgi:trimethylamine:corrinoid methyltransferase-like protein